MRQRKRTPDPQVVIADQVIVLPQEAILNPATLLLQEAAIAGPATLLPQEAVNLQVEVAVPEADLPAGPNQLPLQEAKGSQHVHVLLYNNTDCRSVTGWSATCQNINL
jgi:hypothetical protein